MHVPCVPLMHVACVLQAVRHPLSLIAGSATTQNLALGYRTLCRVVSPEVYKLAHNPDVRHVTRPHPSDCTGASRLISVCACV
jgi:hypothetical protein